MCRWAYFLLTKSSFIHNIETILSIRCTCRIFLYCKYFECCIGCNQYIVESELCSWHPSLPQAESWHNFDLFKYSKKSVKVSSWPTNRLWVVQHKKKFLQNNCLILSISTKDQFRNETEKLKSELLLEGGGHRIPCFCFFFTIFRTFWFIIKSCQSIFLSKWRSKSSKASFCSKTVPTHFANFTLFSTIFSIRPIIVLMSINYFLRNEGRSSQKQTFPRRQWTQILLFFVLLSTSFPIILFVNVWC